MPMFFKIAFLAFKALVPVSFLLVESPTNLILIFLSIMIATGNYHRFKYFYQILIFCDH